MKSRLRFPFALITASVLSVTQPPLSIAQLNDKVIYGADDRLDLYQTKDTRLLALADSTVGLFAAAQVAEWQSRASLHTQPYGQTMQLCHDEPFYDQESGPYCSGALIAPDVVMTAGHCVLDEADCHRIKYVFGFAIKKKGELPYEVPTKDVYGCKQLLGREQTDKGVDWALIKLDRVVKGHAPLKLNRTGVINDKTPLVVIGHPVGLPTKIAGGASVRNASFEGYFTANLDTYGGNSGSPVFNAKTGLVEGILTRGDNDYVKRGSCLVSNVCTDDGCRGEDVTKIAVVVAKLPVAVHRAREAELKPTISSSLDAVSSAPQP